MRQHVSPSFVALAFSKYPGLQGASYIEEGYRRFFLYLLMGPTRTNPDLKTEELLIPHATVRRLAMGWKLAAKDSNNFRSGAWLRKFKETVLPGLEWSDWSVNSAGNGYEGQCRSVITLGIDPEVVNAAKHELATAPQEWEGNIYFDTLKTYNKVNRAKARESKESESLAWTQTYTLVDDQQAIYDVISPTGLDGRLLARLARTNETRIRQAIANLDRPTLKEQQERIYASILDDSRLYYSPTPMGYTPRLHGVGDCVLGLKRPVRNAMLHGLYQMDLKNSQFSILASYLNAPLAIAFAASPTNNLWKYLHGRTQHAHLPIDGYKSFYKGMVYSICFGMGKAKLAEGLSTIECQGLLKDPMIAEILELRKPVLQRLQNDGYMIDLWGRRHEAHKAGDRPNIYGKPQFCKERWSGSLLGTYIQSIELHIMRGVTDVISGQTSFDVITWQHDGLTLNAVERNKPDALFKRCQTTVSARAHDIGIKLFNRPITTFIEMEQL